MEKIFPSSKQFKDFWEDLEERGSSGGVFKAVLYLTIKGPRVGRESFSFLCGTKHFLTLEIWSLLLVGLGSRALLCKYS